MIRSMFLFIFILATALSAQNEIHKTFPAKSKLVLKLVSSDCYIETGGADEIKVDIQGQGDLSEYFEPEFSETGNTLKIREYWHGSSHGGVTWRITAPASTEIDFSSASGELSLTGITANIEAGTASGDITLSAVKGNLEISAASGDIEINSSSGEFDVSTASGQIRMENSQGEFDMSTASGDMKIRDSEGAFDLSCASGDIEARKIILKEESSFSTASGDIEVVPGKSPDVDISLSAASGNVLLDYAGNEVHGYFEFSTKKRSGRIVSPFSFDREEEIELHHDDYLIKSFSRSGNTPVIKLETSSGRAELRK